MKNCRNPLMRVVGWPSPPRAAYWGLLLLAAAVWGHATLGRCAPPIPAEPAPDVLLVPANEIVGLPVIRVGQGYWSIPTEWRFPPYPEGLVHFNFDGVGAPLPFFFMKDSIVVAHQNYVLERSLDDGRPRKNRALKLPVVPETMERMPNHTGWAWSQDQVGDRPAAVFLSPTRPGETDASRVTTLVCRPTYRSLSESVIEICRIDGARVRQLILAPAGDRLMAVSGGSCMLWDISNPKDTHLSEGGGSPDGPNQYFRDREFAFAPRGRLLARAYGDIGGTSGVKFFDAQSGADAFYWEQELNVPFQGIRFSPDGRKLFIFPYTLVQADFAFFEFDVETKAATGLKTKDIVVDGVLNGDQERPVLVTRNRNGSVGFWNWKERKQLASINLKSGEVQDVAVSPDGQFVAVATDERIVFLNIATRKRVGGGEFRHPQIRRLRFAQDGRHLASVGADGELRVWKLDILKAAPPGTAGKRIAPQYDGASF